NRLARATVVARQLLGEPAAEVMPDMERQGFLDVYRQVAATGEAQSLVEWETHYQNPDGSEVVRWLDLIVTPCLVQGRVVAVAGRGWDVTERVLERRRVESELRSTEASLLQARQVVDALQRALLPDRMPVLPGLDVAAAYLPAAQEQVAGGDWFDAVARDGKVVLVVGDVVGHGVSASAAMGQLRAVLLDHVDAGEPIWQVLAALDRWARRDKASFASTVCLVELDPATGAFTYLTAGHPPPLVIAGTGQDSRFLDPSGHGPIGGEPRELGARAGSLAVGEVLMLYSDGLIELPGMTPMQGTVNLARTARDAVANRLLPIGAPASAGERVARHTIEHLVRLRGHTDDVTVLAAQRREPPAALALDGETGDAGLAARARGALLGWLAPLGVRADDRDALLHAAGELVQNAVDHAYPAGTPGAVRLRAALEHDGAAVMVVADDGPWAGPVSDPERGLGLAMVRALADHLEIEGTAACTTATVRHRLHRDAGAVSSLPLAPAPPDAQSVAEVWSHLGKAGPQIGARGPLDAAAAAEIAAALAINTGPGHGPATLDLREVTLLGSAAVHAILRARALAPDLAIIAPTGSVAQHVLALAAIPVGAG
ncbi:MAG TPA: SpoIIE family protein phosphatase, partial [Acidimicrobiales bacterium]|nr:SpoIIE family protein phosphatase [Acidimicrobiales bacterium]